MKKINKKKKTGFTLIELLCVIVILAIIMLIAVSSVGPIIKKIRRKAFEIDAIAAIKQCESSVTTDDYNIENGSLLITSVNNFTENNESYIGLVGIYNNSDKISCSILMIDTENLLIVGNIGENYISLTNKGDIKSFNLTYSNIDIEKDYKLIVDGDVYATNSSDGSGSKYKMVDDVLVGATLYNNSGMASGYTSNSEMATVYRQDSDYLYVLISFDYVHRKNHIPTDMLSTDMLYMYEYHKKFSSSNHKTDCNGQVCNSSLEFYSNKGTLKNTNTYKLLFRRGISNFSSSKTETGVIRNNDGTYSCIKYYIKENKTEFIKTCNLNLDSQYTIFYMKIPNDGVILHNQDYYYDYSKLQSI